MEQIHLQYTPFEDAVFFTDTLKEDVPCVFNTPRNHESLFLVTNGTLFYERDGKTTFIQKGQVGYIERGAIDTTGPYQCHEVSYIAVNFAFDTENSAPKPTLPFRPLASQGLAYNFEKLFHRAHDSFFHKTPGHLAVCGGILLQIIGHLYDEHQFKEDSLKKMHRIEKAIRFLTTKYDDPDFKISSLSALCDMSDKHFRKIFFEVYGKMPFAYLQEYRISRAEILLTHTYKSVSEIAHQCGFSDVYSFSHCFKKHTGLSPQQYRKKS